MCSLAIECVLVRMHRCIWRHECRIHVHIQLQRYKHAEKTTERHTLSKPGCLRPRMRCTHYIPIGMHTHTHAHTHTHTPQKSVGDHALACAAPRRTRAVSAIVPVCVCVCVCVYVCARGRARARVFTHLFKYPPRRT